MAKPTGLPAWVLLLAVVTAVRTVLTAPARALRAQRNTGTRVARRAA